MTFGIGDIKEFYGSPVYGSGYILEYWRKYFILPSMEMSHKEWPR